MGELPLQDIVQVDVGWSWGCTDFLPLMKNGDARIALERFSAVQNFGVDSRVLTADLNAPAYSSRQPLPGVPFSFGSGFQSVVDKARSPRSTLRKSLRPYAERFA